MKLRVLALLLLVVIFSKDASCRRFARQYRNKILEGSETDSSTDAPTETPPSPSDSISSWMRDQFLEWVGPSLQGHIDLGPGLRVDWDIASDSPWWLGDNVCLTEETKESEDEDEDGVHIHSMQVSTTCESTQTANKCIITIRKDGKVKVITKTRQCCHGYEREQGRSGCTKRLQLKNIVDTMQQHLATTQFVEALQGVRLLQDVRRGNFTIFAPTNEALQIADLQNIMENAVSNRGDLIRTTWQLEQMAGNIRNIIASHIVPESKRSSQFRDEQLVETLNDDSSIRINFYNVAEKRRQLMTANCAPVNSTDNIATNGIVHVVDRVIMPAKLTLYEIIAKEHEFSTLKDMLESSEMASDLRKSGQYTLFAPTNRAFHQLMSAELIERFDNNRKCLKNLLQSLLVPNVICSAAIPERKVHTHNMLKCSIDLQRFANDTITVNNDASVQKADVMATNGVLHSIDTVTLPIHAMSVLEVAEKAGAKQFLQLVRHAGLDRTLNSMNDFTLFLPTDDAIQAVPQSVRDRLMSDRQQLKEALLFHVSPVLLSSEDLRNDQRLGTLHGDKQILVKAHRTSVNPNLRIFTRWHRHSTVQCATRLAKQQMQSCGAIIHPIDKLMLPPSGNAFEVLEKDGRFGRFVQLLRNANMVDQLQGDDNPVTIFAPTDEAFELLSEEARSLLNGDNMERLQTLLQNHIVNDVVCCASASLFGHRRRTLAGRTITARVGRSGEMVVDGVNTSECDVMAENGVIHAMQRVLPTAMRSMTKRRNFMSFFNRPLDLSHWWEIPADISRFFDD